jgi:prophage antirepressor-like protein
LQEAKIKLANFLNRRKSKRKKPLKNKEKTNVTLNVTFKKGGNKMYSIKTIESEFGTLRHTTDENGELWFAGTDVYKALGLNRKTLSTLDADDKKADVFPAENARRKAMGISEAGLYMLVLASRKPHAKEFKKWITHEVLPSIRKNGGYVAGEEGLTAEQREKLDSDIRNMSDEVQRLNAENEKLRAKLAATQRKCDKAEVEVKMADSAAMRATKECRQYRDLWNSLDAMKARVDCLEALRKLDNDPVVYGSDGLLTRRSAFLAARA